MNLVSEANKIGLSLPIGLGVSSPYDLVNTSGSQPSGKSQPGIHVATLETQARPPRGEVSQDHPENSERRKQKKGKEISNEEKREENPETFELDPRDKAGREKEEPTELLVLEETEPNKTVKIGAGLSERVKKDISNLLKEYKEIFAWSHEDMPGINRSVISHDLAVNNESKPMVQKRRSFNPERSAAIKEEVSKLLAARSIREVKYPEWVANVVLKKKRTTSGECVWTLLI